jgi:hypothetical protein
MLEQLLSMDGVKFLYSECFCQDSVEAFFGQQRARGRRNTNPTADQFISNSQAIMVGRYLVSSHCSNFQKRSALVSIDELSSPLPKRKAKRRKLL